MTSLPDWLSTLDTDELAAVLAHRPDVLRGVEPRGPGELAERLSTPHSVAASLRRAPTPVLELVQAVLALGRPRRDALADLLDDGHADGEQEHAERVERVLDWLVGRAIVWPDGGGDVLAYPSCLHGLLPLPLGLGSPGRLQFADVPATKLNQMLPRLELPRQTTKAATVDAMVDALADGDRVRTLVAAAPAEVAAELGRMARGEARDDFVVGPAGQVAWQRRHQAIRWAVERGLLVEPYWGGAIEMAAELALALRGPTTGHRSTPSPPPRGRTP